MVKASCSFDSNDFPPNKWYKFELPQGNSSEIKVTMDFRLNFALWMFIIWKLPSLK